MNGFFIKRLYEYTIVMKKTKGHWDATTDDGQVFQFSSVTGYEIIDKKSQSGQVIV